MSQTDYADSVAPRHSGGTAAPTPVPLHLAKLDLLRGLAIIAVLAYHVLGMAYGREHLPWSANAWGGGTLRSLDVPPSFLALLPATLGWTGVAVFFVVSGFCIHLSHARAAKADWRTFAVRRFFRIFPPYFVALVVLGSWWLFGLNRTPAASSVDPFPHVLTHLLLVHNWSYDTLFTISPAFWSIAVEVQLYAIYPLLLLFARRWGWSRALWTTGILEFGLRAADGWTSWSYGEHWLPSWVVNSPVAFWFSWSLGAVLAESVLRAQRLPFTRVPYWVWIGAFLVAYAVRPLFPFTFPLAALATVAWLSQSIQRTGAGDVPPRDSGFLVRSILKVGVVSYSLYLLRQPLVMAVPQFAQWLLPEHVLRRTELFGLGALAAGLALLISVGFHRVVELPSIAIGKRMLAKT